ncbi:MAG: dihydroneopterin aldolase [Microcoleaceae cyanobacterium]
MDKTFIKDIRARGIIGILPWEREEKQDIIINITVFSDMRKAGETDDIADCVDYRMITQNVLNHAENAMRLTVEALANDLAKICLADEKVQRVIVRIEKPGVVRLTSSVGVEIERSKEDYQ